MGDEMLAGAVKQVRELLVEAGGAKPIATPEGWAAKREAIRAKVEAILGRSPAEVVEPRMRVLEEHQDPEYRRLKVEYLVEEDDPVRAWVLIPPKEKRRGGAAVLCLHGTSPEGKDTQLGEGGKPGRDYGRQLARRGFVSFCPDHMCAGERITDGCDAYDTAPFYQRHPEWSMVGKAIWDGQRALDVMCALPEVDAAKLGAVGHSLGGHGAMFVAAFDERVKASVSSCGLTTWVDNPLRVKWARDQWYVYFPALRPIFLADQEMPFDLHEFAALIAPRAFLNISGMGDGMYGNNETLPEAGRQLDGVWRLLGAEEGFANFLFGAGHDVPIYSQTLTAGWFEHWLS